MSALHKVIYPNDFFKVGVFLEEFDGVMQEVKTANENGRLKLGGYTGLVIPAWQIKPYTVRIQKRGLDRNVQRATY
jgi:hypothetical protein